MQPTANDLEQRAEQERARIFHQDILGRRAVHMYPLDAGTAGEELSRFARELWRMPNMDGYFDRRHLTNLRAHLAEAQHGFTTLPAGGILEILSLPTLPAEAMGFHIFSVFDPADERDRGRFIGYAVWSLEKGHAPFGRAEAVRMAFDIFPPYREQRYRKVPFVNHDIYNISRRILYAFKPQRFLVDAQSQISQPRTGEPLKRTVYYLKRGYYPPDQKPRADACLVRIVAGEHLAEADIHALLRTSRAPFWVYPVAQYLSPRPSATGAA